MLSVRYGSRTDSAFVSSVEELLQSTTRILILMEIGISIAWYVVASEFLRPDLTVILFLVVTGLAAMGVVALQFVSRSLLIAQALWQVGLAAALTITVVHLREPALLYLYALLPLMAAITVGWPAAVLAEGAVVALLCWMTRSPAMLPVSTSVALATACAGALMGTLGWAATQTLVTVAEWSFLGFYQAIRKMEEARDQRLELKQAQEDLLLANRELARLSDRLKAMCQVAEEARRAKEEFVANVSHELRTPLNMIIGFSEMITELPQVYGAKLPSTLLADIAAIRRNSQHLAKLVDDVLDLSQVEAGRMALSKEWVSLPAIIDEAIIATQALFQSKGLYLHSTVPPDLPQVFCDGTRIRQVVLNLLSNAGRFTQQGGVRVEVRREGDNVLVSVSDTGPGIASQDQKRLFEPFHQLDGSKSHGGSGLGLAISKQFVEMHGGRMWLESRVGEGTCFHFQLPVAAAAPAALHDDVLRWSNPSFEYEPRTRRSKAPTPIVTPRFVVMEQTGALQRLFSRYQDDIEIVTAADSEEAMRELGRSPAQALLVNTPNVKENPNLLNQLPRLPYDTPAIACWVPGPEEAARRLGVVRYLIKPIPRTLLLSTLAELEGVRSVLVVDDEPEVLQLFTRMLSSGEQRYRVLQASNGERALSLLRERRPDVVLLDLIMPGMDGFGLLQAKAQDPSIRGIPVIVTSSRDPAGEAILSDTLVVRQASGLSAQNLLACIRAISEVLSPASRSERRGQPAGPAG